MTIFKLKETKRYLLTNPPVNSLYKRVIFRLYFLFYFILEKLLGSNICVKILKPIRKITFKTRLSNGVLLYHKIEHLPYVYETVYSGIQFKLKKSSVVLDIGAHIGSFSLNLSNYKKIYALEPNNENYKFLKRNIQENGLSKKIIPFKMAASNKEGYKKLYISGGSGSHSFYLKSKDKFEKVRITSLNEFVKKNKIKNIDLIKIDVEGEEKKVVQGCSELLEKKAPTMIIEHHPWYTPISNILKELKDKNYKIKRIDNLTILAQKRKDL